jgi:CheY-like chemotaxis protein
MRGRTVVGEEGLRILLVDDMPLVLGALQRGLQRCGYAPAVADSARGALEQLQREPFAVLVSDYKMPGHDGLWLLAQARLLCPDCHRVLISGGPVPDIRVHLDDGLVERFLNKPIGERELAACIEGLCGEA